MQIMMRFYLTPLLLLSISIWVGAQKVEQVKTIVIDPGHGGKDIGTHQGSLTEKTLTLEYSILLKDALESSLPNVEVFLTRDDDRFLRLSERSDYANELNADLFISLHCNHHAASSVHGSELYILGLHKSDENLAVVLRENESLVLEELHEDSPQMDFIFSNLQQGGNLKESARLAQNINDALNRGTSLKQRGVKQAGFFVLKSTTMPATLFEMAYLSNAKDVELLNDLDHKAQLISSTVDGIRNYLFPPGSLLDASPLSYSFIIHKSPSETPDPKLPWDKLPHYSIVKAGSEYHYMVLDYEVPGSVEEFMSNFRELGFVDVQESNFYRNTSNPSRKQSK